MNMRVMRTVTRILRIFASSKRHISTTPRRNYILEYSPNAKLDKSITDKYMCLPMPERKCQVKYVWIDGTGEHLRAKTRTLDYIPTCPAEVPKWQFDGSSAYLAQGRNSDVYLVPVAMYKDPFRRGSNKLVLCETYYHDNRPTKSNHRKTCKEVLQQIRDLEPQFGIEQEFHLMDMDNRPLSWLMNGEPTPGDMYYCGVGAKAVIGSDIMETHYRACLYAGVEFFGSNAESVPTQWEYQIGICNGIKAADDVWMSRFILYRIAEDYGVRISLHPKLFPNWKGAGMHTNYSTKDMRSDGGLKVMADAMPRLARNHKEDILKYDPKDGQYNVLRLTGKDGISSMTEFTYGVERGVSVRIKEDEGKDSGYLEDRRPAANADPYRVVECLVRAVSLE